jgi:hypothetical protein
MASFLQLHEIRTQEYIQRNNAGIFSQVASRHKDLMKKIETYRKNLTETEQEEISVDDILQKIQNDSMFRAVFRKAPTRQNIAENVQIEWIKRFVPDTLKLNPNVGGRYISGGDMHVVASKIARPENSTKTFDTYSSATNTYGILKLTKIAGGAQDNQYHDVKSFIRHIVSYFQAHPDASEKFKFYLDGGYYSSDKRTELNSMIPPTYNDRIIITSCESNAV